MSRPTPSPEQEEVRSPSPDIILRCQNDFLTNHKAAWDSDSEGEAGEGGPGDVVRKVPDVRRDDLASRRTSRPPAAPRVHQYIPTPACSQRDRQLWEDIRRASHTSLGDTPNSYMGGVKASLNLRTQCGMSEEKEIDGNVPDLQKDDMQVRRTTVNTATSFNRFLLGSKRPAQEEVKDKKLQQPSYSIETPRQLTNLTTAIRSPFTSNPSYGDVDGEDDEEEAPLPDVEKDDMLARRTRMFQRSTGRTGPSFNLFLPVPGAAQHQNTHASGSNQFCKNTPVTGLNHLSRQQTAPGADLDSSGISTATEHVATPPKTPTRKCVAVREDNTLLTSPPPPTMPPHDQRPGGRGEGSEEEAGTMGGLETYTREDRRTEGGVSDRRPFWMEDDDLPPMISKDMIDMPCEDKWAGLKQPREQSQYERMKEQYTNFQEEEEEWRNDLARWKSRRRSASQDLIRKEEERKMLEKRVKEESHTQKKTIKTYREIVEEKEHREAELCDAYRRAGSKEEAELVLHRYALRFTISDATLDSLQLPTASQNHESRFVTTQQNQGGTPITDPEPRRTKTDGEPIKNQQHTTTTQQTHDKPHTTETLHTHIQQHTTTTQHTPIQQHTTTTQHTPIQQHTTATQHTQHTESQIQNHFTQTQHTLPLHISPPSPIHPLFSAKPYCHPKHQPIKNTLTEHQPLKYTLTEHQPLKNILTEHQPVKNTLTEHQPVKNTFTEHQPVKNTLTEHQPLKNTLTEHQPVKNTLTEHQPVKNILTEHQPVKNTLTEHQPLNNTLTEHQPVKNTLTDHQPVKNTLTEHQHVKNTLTEHQHVKKILTEHQPVKNTLTEHQPVKNTLTEHQPVKNILTEHQPVKNTLIEQQPVINTLTEHQPVKNTLTEHQPVINTLAEHQPVKNTLTEHQPVKNTLSEHQTVVKNTQLEHRPFKVETPPSSLSSPPPTEQFPANWMKDVSSTCALTEGKSWVVTATMTTDHSKTHLKPRPPDTTSNTQVKGLSDRSVKEVGTDFAWLSNHNTYSSSVTEGLQGNSETIESPMLNLAKRVNHWVWNPDEERSRQKKWQQEQERVLQIEYLKEQEKLKVEWERAQREVEEDEKRHNEEERKILEETAAPLFQAPPIQLLIQAESIAPAQQIHKAEQIASAQQIYKTNAITPKLQICKTEPIPQAQQTCKTEAITPKLQICKTEAITQAQQICKTEAITQAQQICKTEAITPKLQICKTEPITQAQQTCKTEAITPKLQSCKTEPITQAQQICRTEAIAHKDSQHQHAITPIQLSEYPAWESESCMGQKTSLDHNSQMDQLSSVKRRVSGKRLCSGCCEPVGKGAAMKIDTLGLYYHLACFKCGMCNGQLSDTCSGTDVRIRNGLLSCHHCYLTSRVGGQPTTL